MIFFSPVSNRRTCTRCTSTNPTPRISSRTTDGWEDPEMKKIADYITEWHSLVC
jgi:hypothetical protein